MSSIREYGTKVFPELAFKTPAGADLANADFQLYSAPFNMGFSIFLILLTYLIPKCCLPFADLRLSRRVAEPVFGGVA